MGPRPRLLDLFCCAGGASVGYFRAGFDVTGVDTAAHRNYPFRVIVGDALQLTQSFLRSFDAIAASPPCQGYTSLRHAPGAVGAPRLIGAVRDMLSVSGRPWVIENVEDAGAEMRSPLLLCGSMFGLGAQGCQLRRHRLFESNVTLTAPPCVHDDRPVIGIYGGHARKRASRHGGRGTRDVWTGGHVRAASEALGIDWMTLDEMSESIPPAYTEHIGRQLLVRVMEGFGDG